MTLTLDKMSRIVIPKAVRDRFSLQPGAELDVHVDGDEIHLRPMFPQSALAEVDGVLVCASEVPQEVWDLHAWMEDEREKRGRELAGMG